MAGWGSHEVVYEDAHFRVVRKAKAFSNQAAEYVLETPHQDAMGIKYYRPFNNLTEKPQQMNEDWKDQFIIRLITRMRGLEHQLANPKKDLEDRS